MRQQDRQKYLTLNTLTLRLGLNELADRHVDLGHAPGRANAGDKLMTLVASALAGGGCIDDADELRCGRDRPGAGLRGQRAIHPGHLPARLPVGPRPSVGPGEPGVAGPGLGRRGRTRLRTADHRPGLHHLRDLPTNQRCHAAIGAPGGAYVVRSPASDMGTSW